MIVVLTRAEECALFFQLDLKMALISVNTGLAFMNESVNAIKIFLAMTAADVSMDTGTKLHQAGTTSTPPPFRFFRG